jgi:MFS family permease
MLLISDLFVVTGFGLVEPIFGIYMNDAIVNGTVATVGIATGIYLISKSVIQIPFSRKVDAHGARYAARWLFYGSLLVAVSPLMYIFAKDIYFLYFAQLVSGIGAGVAYPAWLGLWSKYIDQGKESFQWSFYSTLIGVASAAAAPLGGFIADMYGFNVLFIVMSILALIGTFLTLIIQRSLIADKIR